MSVDWANIPSVILLEILQYLSRQDRFTCSEVCRSWSNTVSNPLLWTGLQIFLDKDLTDPITNNMIRNYSPHIRSLDLAWSIPYVPQRWIRNRMINIAQDTSQFLIFLRDCNVSLIYLKLTDWYFAWKFKKVIYHLTTFLKYQRRLKYLDLSNSSLNKVEISKVLLACRLSSASIIYLNLHSAFQDMHYLYTNSTLLRAVQQFTSLETLKIDYSSFSEKMLMLYSKEGNNTLRFIELYIRDSDRRSHIISSEAWANVTQNCKNLEVAIHFFNVCHYDDIYYFLIDTIPLKIFSLTCGLAWDQKRSRNYCGTLMLVKKNYRNTIEQISINLRNNRERVDSVLYDIILSCKQLKIIEFDGILQNLNFIRDICALQSKPETFDTFNYRYFQVCPKIASVHNNLFLSKIWRKYVKKMNDNNVHFYIENYHNPTVKIFL